MIAKVINLLGIMIYAFSVLVAIGYYLILSSAERVSGLTFLIMLIYTIAGVLVGLFLQGFSRVIEYIKDIRDCMIGHQAGNEDTHEQTKHG